jgi:hypothetical protein
MDFVKAHPGEMALGPGVTQGRLEETKIGLKPIPDLTEVPVEIQIFRSVHGQDTLGQRGFPSLPGPGNESHLSPDRRIGHDPFKMTFNHMTILAYPIKKSRLFYRYTQKSQQAISGAFMLPFIFLARPEQFPTADRISLSGT